MSGDSWIASLRVPKSSPRASAAPLLSVDGFRIHLRRRPLFSRSSSPPCRVVRWHQGKFGSGVDVAMGFEKNPPFFYEGSRRRPLAAERTRGCGTTALALFQSQLAQGCPGAGSRYLTGWLGSKVSASLPAAAPMRCLGLSTPHGPLHPGFSSFATTLSSVGCVGSNLSYYILLRLKPSPGWVGVGGGGER